MVIARSAILAHQDRLAVISHNIANVNTPGYHRQRALLETNPPIQSTMLETRRYDVGTGVRVADVVRVYDRMKEMLLLDEQSSAASHGASRDALQVLESIVGGAGEAALGTQMDRFWSAWQDLANHSDDLAYRGVLVERAVAMTDSLREARGRIANFRNELAGGDAVSGFTGLLATDVDAVNSIAANIQSVNQRLSLTLSMFGSGDLRDQRDQLISELGKQIDIAVDTAGNVTVDGQLLVSADGLTLNALSITDVSAGVQLELDGAAVTATGGRIGAWTAVLGIADSAAQGLDVFAAELIAQVNAVHNSDLSTTGDAYDLDGNRSTIDFFTGTSATDIAINTAICDPADPLDRHPERIAAAATRFSAGPPPVPNAGDGAKALEIADLASVRRATLANQTFGGFLAAQAAAVGAQLQEETALAGDGDLIVQMLTDAVQGESGVNLDEEMVEMLTAQRAYESAARLFSTLDELMNTIINGLGR
jgi:flagellar hook-associated protein 1 FlgK